MTQTPTHRPLYEIADEISADWKQPSFLGVYALKCMKKFKDINSNCGPEYGRATVIQMLHETKNWHGPVAEKIKAELQDIKNTQVWTPKWFEKNMR